MIRKQFFIGCIVVGSIVTDAVLYVPTAAQQSQHCDSCIVRAGEIVGRVLDVEGRPVSGANVYAMKSDHQKGAIPSAETDSDGSFRLAVVPGEYSVYAGKESAGHPEKFGGFYSVIKYVRVTVRVDEVTDGIEIVNGITRATRVPLRRTLFASDERRQ